MASFFKLLLSRWRRADIYNKPAFWDEKASQYKGRSVSMWPNSLLNKHYRHEQLGFLYRALPKVEGLKILDIGCGTGELSRYYASRGAAVTGIDFSEESIKIAQGEPSLNPIRYEAGSIFELPYADKEFDLISCFAVITVACKNAEDVRQVFEGVRRVLKPGGQLVVVEPLHKSFLSRVLRMNEEEFIDLLRSLGFQIQTVNQLHFWPVRIFLSHSRLPRALNVCLIRLGLGWMRRSKRRSMGDYRAILASIRPDAETL